jgi:hypothetical protein
MSGISSFDYSTVWPSLGCFVERNAKFSISADQLIQAKRTIKPAGIRQNPRFSIIRSLRLVCPRMAAMPGVYFFELARRDPQGAVAGS